MVVVFRHSLFWYSCLLRRSRERCYTSHSTTQQNIEYIEPRGKPSLEQSCLESSVFCGNKMLCEDNSRVSTPRRRGWKRVAPAMDLLSASFVSCSFRCSILAGDTPNLETAARRRRMSVCDSRQSLAAFFHYEQATFWPICF